MAKENQNLNPQKEGREEYISPQKGDQQEPTLKPAEQIRKDQDTPTQRHGGQTENY